MPFSRRELIRLTGAVAVIGGCVPADAQDGDSRPPLPKRENFETGDFVWPKKPGAYVPYNAGMITSVNGDEEIWKAEREAFLNRLAKEPGYFSLSDIEQIKRLTFREFYARYAGDQEPGVPGLYGMDAGIYVGHVGIVEVEAGGEIWVIEALWGKGVVRWLYRDWLAARVGEIVWHGRVRQIGKEDRAKIVIECRKQVGKPYDFWNFALDDDSAFYCSKLVWLAVSRALGFPIDGNSNGKRVFWFSPKQLLYAKTITRLHDPGPYANR